jgi:hypothetical protein
MDGTFIAHQHNCQVEVGERWCPSMAWCYNLNEGEDACLTIDENGKKIIQDVSEEILEVLHRYTGIVPEGAPSNYTDDIVSVPCFEPDEETPCGFNNNPIVLVEALKTIRRRRDYVRDRFDLLKSNNNDEEEQDVLDNLREQYGRSENLIVSRFSKVCNERNDHLEDLKSKKLIAQSELDKRNNLLKISDGNKDIQIIQKESESLSRDVQSVESQVEDLVEDVQECDTQRTDWELFSNHTGYDTARDSTKEEEQEEQKEEYLLPVPVHIKGSIQLLGALPARVVLFRKAIRSAIASVVGCENVQVTVTLNAPTPGPTYPIDIKAGSYEEAQEMYNKISMLQHTKSNNKITNVLNAQGLITLKSTVFALEQVEGKDGDTFSQRNANQHTTEIHTSNMLRKKKILHSECNIRSSELIILKNVAKSLKRKYTSSMSMNNNNIEFVKLVRQYGEVRKQIKYDIKFIKTHGCPPMPATETTTKETKMNSKAIEAAMKAADAAESQLATLSDMTSIIAAAQANITASSNASNTTMLNSTAAVTNTTTTNTTTSDLVVENEENENEKILPTRNATI